MGTQWTNDLRTVCPNSGGFGEEFYSNPHGSDGKEFACNDGDPGSIPGLGRPPGVENGNPLQPTLAWRIPWTDGLQFMGSQRVRHD